MTHLHTHCLRKGTLLYHGTSSKDIFEEGGYTPNAPAWFSTSEAVARHFVGWHIGPCPRILVYRVTSNIPKLPTITSKNDLDALLWGKAAIGSEDMADFVCNFRNLPGWYIPHNYPEGDDIMLCSTNALEFVRRICVDPDASWGPGEMKGLAGVELPRLVIFGVPVRDLVRLRNTIREAECRDLYGEKVQACAGCASQDKFCVQVLHHVPGYCSPISEEIERIYGWKQSGGCYLKQKGDRLLHIAHLWNILPNGYILDVTADQFMEGDDVRVVPPSDKRYNATCDCGGIDG